MCAMLRAEQVKLNYSMLVIGKYVGTFTHSLCVMPVSFCTSVFHLQELHIGLHESSGEESHVFASATYLFTLRTWTRGQEGAFQV